MSVMNQQPVVVQTQGTPFLPAPRMPVNRAYPEATEVAAVVGEELAGPLAELEAAYRSAAEAVRELESCRPGGLGAAWRQALDDDAKAYGTAETRPKKWKVAALLEGDPQRWATASAAVRDLPAAAARCGQRLDRAKIGSIAATVMDARGNQWGEAAAEAWAGRRDAAVAWQHYRRGEELLAGFEAAAAVRRWAGWVEPDPTKITTEHGLVTSLQQDVPPIVHTLPADPDARGMWLCTELVLRPDTRWLWLPPTPAVLWPEGTEQMRERAVGEDMQRFVALREHGHYAVKR